MQMGRPHVSWLRLTEAYLKDMGMAAWRLSGRWPDGDLSGGYRHDGSGVCLGDGQTESYLKDMGMTGLASAWVMARRRT